jgi:hypothetical protein
VIGRQRNPPQVIVRMHGLARHAVQPFTS